MKEDSDRRKAAEEYLRQLLEDAIDRGADTVEFERVPEGVEVTLYAGPTGLGTLLDDDELENAIFSLVEKRSRSRNADRGTLEFPVHGKSEKFGLEWYDSFGEWCFRIRISR